MSNFSIPLLCVTAALLAQAQEIPEVARLLSDVIRIDTSNPPGNEGKVAEFLKTKFSGLNFEIEIIPTPQPGKAHFIARLRGDGSKKPILLAGHEDVLELFDLGVERVQMLLGPADLFSNTRESLKHD